MKRRSASTSLLRVCPVNVAGKSLPTPAVHGAMMIVRGRHPTRSIDRGRRLPICHDSISKRWLYGTRPVPQKKTETNRLTSDEILGV
jgi:hypothetical protein